MSKPQIIAISGISGAGKSTAAKVLEDFGFFVIDNLPAPLLTKLLILIENADLSLPKLAIVIDVRESFFLKDFIKSWSELKLNFPKAKLIFFDASDETIIRRFKETRRRHPLENGKGIRHDLKCERKLLTDIADVADLSISTDNLTVHDLKRRVKKELVLPTNHNMVISLLSFGFKNGIPTELDMCLDARFLPNPFFEPKLKDLTGLDKPVAIFVLNDKRTQQFLSKSFALIKYLIPLYVKEGKAYFTIAIGCTGGQHRSPALIEELANRCILDGVKINIRHRDLSK